MKNFFSKVYWFRLLSIVFLFAALVASIFDKNDTGIVLVLTSLTLATLSPLME